MTTSNFKPSTKLQAAMDSDARFRGEASPRNSAPDAANAAFDRTAAAATNYSTKYLTEAESDERHSLLMQQYATLSRELAQVSHDLYANCDRLTKLADDTLCLVSTTLKSAPQQLILRSVREQY